VNPSESNSRNHETRQCAVQSPGCGTRKRGAMLRAPGKFK
jgi:hypothetical protein